MVWACGPKTGNHFDIEIWLKYACFLHIGRCNNKTKQYLFVLCTCIFVGFGRSNKGTFDGYEDTHVILLDGVLYFFGVKKYSNLYFLLIIKNKLLMIFFFPVFMLGINNIVISLVFQKLS